jgi:hypothetical protein
MRKEERSEEGQNPQQSKQVIQCIRRYVLPSSVSYHGNQTSNPVSNPLPQRIEDNRKAMSDAAQNIGNEEHPTKALAIHNDGDAIVRDAGRAFTLFPKLPLEIRLMIWVMTFKKQHVDIDLDLSCDDQINLGRQIPRPVFPVALHVNHESRTETLRHYCIISSSNHHTICVNFSLDSCYMRRKLVGGIVCKRYYEDWLSDLDSEAPGGLRSVEELEIGNLSGIR